jgi:hypothetical protein
VVENRFNTNTRLYRFRSGISMRIRDDLGISDELQAHGFLNANADQEREMPKLFSVPL